MHPNHFVNKNDGSHWTLATLLGEVLGAAEKLYGERDKSWTILGIEFGPKGNPQTWYPNPAYKNVVIQLSTNALDSTPIACYQISHECIHLLAPTGSSKALVIEEGLATVFSEDVTQAYFGVVFHAEIFSYIEAASKVRELLAIDSAAISKLRRIEPVFDRMSAQTFSAAGIVAPSELIEFLTSTFVR